MRLATTRVLAGLIALAAPATSAAAGDYYAGKSIDLLIGAPPGGGYDIYARALARHYGRHISGQPTIVAKNMPGAASAISPARTHVVARRIKSLRPRSRMGRRLGHPCAADNSGGQLGRSRFLRRHLDTLSSVRPREGHPATLASRGPRCGDPEFRTAAPGFPP